MGIDEGNLQVMDVSRRGTGKLSNNYCYTVPKVAVNTIVPRSPFFAFCTPEYRLL